MLLAEIHGKHCQEARQKEDYLTSAVFGHLRFVLDGCFWQALLTRALSLDSVSLETALLKQGFVLDTLDLTSTRFWPWLGQDQPDVVLHFCNQQKSELAVVIEAKLWSGKSDFGERDQLLRYLRAADRYFGGAETFRPLIYLTAQSGLEDVRDSLDQPMARDLRARQRIFLLEWQDIHEVADTMRGIRPLLAETADFLEAVGQIRFRSFRTPAGPLNGTFYRAEYFADIEKYNGGRFYAD